MSRGFRNAIAGLGAVAAGYVKGKALFDDIAYTKEKREREKIKWAEEDKARAGDAEIRAILSGGLGDAQQPRSGQDAGLAAISPIDGRPLRTETTATGEPGAAVEAPGLSIARPAMSADPAVPSVSLASQPAPQMSVAPDADQIAQTHSFERGQRVGELQGEVAAIHDRRVASSYLRNKAPQVIDAYVRQGRLREAQQFRSFVDSEEGQSYTRAWARGARKLSIGDHWGALSDWQRLYNDQLYDDGRTVKLTPHEDGKQVQVDVFDGDGRQINSLTQPIDAFARQAGMALAPEKLVEMRAQQEAKREAEAANLAKAAELERLRQDGQAVAEDRRDARTRMQIDAADRRHASSLAARERDGGLTIAQQRSNFEIDAAREMVAGLSDEDIRQRTAPTTATGRENPLYDPALARAAKLAGRRKIGDDEAFDQRQPRQPAQPSGGDVAQRFQTDPQMKGNRLGRVTEKGREVFDASGKLIGFYQ
jgi:hypothetical protein